METQCAQQVVGDKIGAKSAHGGTIETFKLNIIDINIPIL